MTQHPSDSNGAAVGVAKVPSTLGHFFSTSAFPPDQQARIAAAAAVAESPCWQIVRNYAARTKNYKGPWMKTERIHGAKVGSPLYRTTSIQRIAAYLAAPSQRNHGLAWAIYREAAKLYIEHELSALDTLFAENHTTAVYTTADALRATCGCAVEYGVSDEEILRFYEIWGVERVTDFESLLREWMKPDEAAQQRRQLAALKAEVDALRKQLVDKTGEIGELRQSIEHVRSEAHEAGAHHGDLADMHRALGERVGELADTLGRVETRGRSFETQAQGTEAAVARLREEVVAASSLKADIDKVDRQTTKGFAEVTATTAALARELRSEIGAVTAAVDAKLVELSATAVEAADSRATRSRSANTPRDVGLGASLEWSPATRVLSTRGEFLRALMTSFRARGVDPGSARRIHAAISAQIPVVVVGALGVDALEAYTDVVFGGRSIKVHVTPALMEPADLFGRVDAERGTYRPHHSRLLDAAIATDSSRPGMVILEGINRAPTESYLVPLLSHRGAIRLFHETMSAPEGVPPAVEWPRHLRIAATCVSGATSLPVARDVWARAVAIEVVPLEDAAGETEPAAISELSMDSSLIGEATVPAELVSSIVQTWPEARACRAIMERFARRLAAASSNEEELLQAAVETSILPLISGLPTEEERQAALDAIIGEVGTNHADELRALDIRLRRSLA